jgi:hypothetical protein
MSVYGSSYPEYVMDLLPQNSINRKNFEDSGFKKLLSNATGILSDYILNAKYIDFPVTGLSESQIIKLNKWLCDRYNENALIAKGVLNFNPEQKDEDNFVIEPYLVDQYQGSVRREEERVWNGKVFLPTFRFPFEEEVNYLKLNSKNNENFHEYRFNSKDFLWLWSKNYIKVDKAKSALTIDCHCTTSTLSNNEYYGLKDNSNIDTTFFKYRVPPVINYGEVKNDYYEPITFISEGKNYVFEDKKLSTAFNSAKIEASDIELFEEIEFTEKNELGMLDHIIIGETPTHSPVAVKFNWNGMDNSPIYKIYWLAYNKVLDIK